MLRLCWFVDYKVLKSCAFQPLLTQSRDCNELVQRLTGKAVIHEGNEPLPTELSVLELLDGWKFEHGISQPFAVLALARELAWKVLAPSFANNTEALLPLAQSKPQCPTRSFTHRATTMWCLDV